MDKNKSEILRDILKLAKSELNENGHIGYTMPDGKHHIYIYVDDSMGHVVDVVEPEDYYYVIEPNRVVDGAMEPMGDTTAADYNDFAELLVGCAWCIDEFERDAELVAQKESVSVGCLPDESITIDEMREAGYSWEGMLPLREAAAIRLWNELNLPVYKLYDDDSESMIEVESFEDLTEALKAHVETGGIFGVEKTDWNSFLEKQSLDKTISVAEAQKSYNVANNRDTRDFGREL